MNEFLAMGGYALYVWPAYGVTLIVLAGIWLAGAHRRHQVERDLAALEKKDGVAQR